MDYFKLPMPKTEQEKILEIYILNKIIECIKADMSFVNILNVLERVRHVVTELELERE